MEDKDIQIIIEELNLQESISLKSIPNLDLYMDQVITLFEDKLKHTKRYQEDKLLTKTMINNYTKDKLLMPAVKKKYTREHIILMILLYGLKQILTISDIKTLFGILIREEKVDAAKLENVYTVYLALKKEIVRQFSEEVRSVEQEVEKQLKDEKLEGEEIEREEYSEEGIKNMLLVTMFTEKANYYKRLAEKIIDQNIIKEKENNR
ncbi:hypothetical protein CS063_10500 [Sporanaerobium hydrogeniformans]|uniref:Uncharacterized protein n=1 Tax=Sporanaerobium hydrogeniformans TaxID=3072179 RepID=A0AC61DCM9_9FIRM|nr:DUF1836 domain-containing protein [Sporanaerobium hydrogeniformans]PHV70508.1 hypothetical protein CS063_10500 [Sporanaerobium hydrogeniformans]